MSSAGRALFSPRIVYIIACVSGAVTGFQARAASSSSPTRTIQRKLSRFAMSTLQDGDILFGKFRIPKDSIFYETENSAAFVNLRPIVPGHVLVVPKRIAPLLSDLNKDEYTDLWLTVRTVQAALQPSLKSTAFNVAVQDGRAAGQSVPHAHVHILPRTDGDLERNDDIYDSLQEWAPTDDLKQEISLDVPADGDRADRTPREMADEAASYRILFNA